MIHLRLYVTARTVSAERARAALAALELRLIDTRGPGAVITEIVDVLENPQSAVSDDIFATPTLVRLSPGPVMKLFGDLSSAAGLFGGLGLDVADPPASGQDDGPWPIIPSDTSSLPAAALD